MDILKMKKRGMNVGIGFNWRLRLERPKLLRYQIVLFYNSGNKSLAEKRSYESAGIK